VPRPRRDSRVPFAKEKNCPASAIRRASCLSISLYDPSLCLTGSFTVIPSASESGLPFDSEFSCQRTAYHCSGCASCSSLSFSLSPFPLSRARVAFNDELLSEPASSFAFCYYSFRFGCTSRPQAFPCARPPHAGVVCPANHTSIPLLYVSTYIFSHSQSSMCNVEVVKGYSASSRLSSNPLAGRSQTIRALALPVILSTLQNSPGHTSRAYLNHHYTDNPPPQNYHT
jgi:hypothetical protein